MDDAEAERLKKQIEALQTQFGAMRERTVAAEAEVERLKGELEIARAVAPHFYHPSTMHMGDCSVCGNTQDAPQHQIKAEVERLKRAINRALESLCGDYPSMAADLRAALTEPVKEG